GAQLGRSAGAKITLMAKEGQWAALRMPSGETRRVHVDCKATIGVMGNSEHGNIEWGKAGRKRWKGIRPHNRGVSMNRSITRWAAARAGRPAAATRAPRGASR